jgi:GNAT superfamily N-acetyltransferase
MAISSVTSESQLRRLYDHVLVPSFPPTELCAWDEFSAGWATGTTLVWAALDEADPDVVLGAAVCDELPGTGTSLLTYLALAPGARGGGLGSSLYSTAREWAMNSSSTKLYLAEIEHPAVHSGSAGGGDPVARLRFYARFGVTALALPYFQPAIPGLPRVPGLILGVAGAQPVALHDGGVDGALVRAFLTTNLTQSEGRVGDDPATVALLAAAEPDAIPTFGLDEVDRIPFSRIA